MKKMLITVSLLLGSMVLIGCGSQSASKPNDATKPEGSGSVSTVPASKPAEGSGK